MFTPAADVQSNGGETGKQIDQLTMFFPRAHRIVIVHSGVPSNSFRVR